MWWPSIPSDLPLYMRIRMLKESRLAAGSLDDQAPHAQPEGI